MIAKYREYLMQLESCHQQAKAYLNEINELEKNSQLSDTEKLFELEIIKEKIKIISVEIDNIKKDITLLTDFSIN